MKKKTIKSAVIAGMCAVSLLGMIVTGCGAADTKNKQSTAKTENAASETIAKDETTNIDETTSVSETTSTSEVAGEEEATPFMKSLELGKDHSYDLNKDGTEENFLYNCKYEEGEEGDGAVTEFKVNGVDYSELTEELWNPCDTEFYLVDIDEKDDFVEIAILANGPSDDLTTDYYRFDGNSVKYIGYTQQHIGTDECYTDGQGNIHGYMRIDFGTTKPVLGKYTINESGNLEAVSEWRCYVESSESTYTHNIIQEIKVYKDADLSADTVTINAEFGPVALYSTDGQEWIAIINANDEIYYIHMNDGMTLDNMQDINEKERSRLLFY